MLMGRTRSSVLTSDVVIRAHMIMAVTASLTQCDSVGLSSWVGGYTRGQLSPLWRICDGVGVLLQSELIHWCAGRAHVRQWGLLDTDLFAGQLGGCGWGLLLKTWLQSCNGFAPFQRDLLTVLTDCL
jgi:hypothetical protein